MKSNFRGLRALRAFSLLHASTAQHRLGSNQYPAPISIQAFPAQHHITTAPIRIQHRAAPSTTAPGSTDPAPISSQRRAASTHFLHDMHLAHTTAQHTTPQHHSTTAPQHSTAQHHSTTAPQHHSTTAARR